MKTATPVLILLLIFTSFISYGQLLIQYDYETHQIHYSIDGEKVNRPVVKDGQSIQIELINYNNYVYDVEITESFNTKKVGGHNGLPELLLTDIPQISNVTELPYESQNEQVGIGNEKDYEPDDVPPSILPPPMAPPAISDQESLALWQDYEKLRLQFEKEHLAIEKELLRIENERRSEDMILQLVNQLDELFIQMDNFDSQLKYRKAELRRIKKNEKQVNNASHQVQELKYNAQLPISIIKTQASQILIRALDLEGHQLEDFSALKTNSRQIEKIEDILIRQENDQIAYDQYINEGRVILNQLNTLVPQRSNVVVAHEKLKAKSENRTQAIIENELLQKEGENLITNFQSKDPQIMTDIWVAYQEISRNSFKKTHYVKAAEDEVVFTIKLNPKPGFSIEDQGLSSVELSPISIPVYGGFKINTSVGLNFAQFIDPIQSYALQSNEIVAEGGDAFLPFVTTFMHFYFERPRQIVLGGSLGIGMPLGGSTGFESSSFFLGPSLFIGGSNRVIVNAGLMGAKVERLGAGFEVGDLLAPGQNYIPLQSNYDFGFYFGVSFNLNN